MGTRRKSRELTMQMLFQGDLGKQTPEEVRKLFWASAEEVDAETSGLPEDLIASPALARKRLTRLSSRMPRTGASSAWPWWTAICSALPWPR